MMNGTSGTRTGSRRGIAALVVRVRGSVAGVIRAAAGAAGGVLVTRNNRRGSFLVIVVGVLALMAVAAILYASLGISDRERGGAAVRGQQVNEYPARVGDYIARVIGDSTFNWFHEHTVGTGTNAVPVAQRAAWDYPSTDWNLRSTTNASTDPTRLFNPMGGMGKPWWRTQNDPPVTRSQASTPWLASVMPARLDPSAPPRDVQKPWLDFVDWLHISNLSPDGRFVNLANLRGNFKAEPGFGVDANGKPRMSEHLSVLNTMGDTLSETTHTFSGGASSPIMPQRPADYASWQRGMFRPVGDARAEAATNPRLSLLNQWADTDGDGFTDARWFALDDASDPAGIIEILPRDPVYRFFIAARVIDLSALVNVNTASDFIASPDARYPAGSSPGEVDLRRVLMMPDTYEFWNLGTGQVFGYNALPRPSASVDTYALYDAAAAANAGHYGYWALRLALATGITPFERADRNPPAGYFGAAMEDNWIAGYPALGVAPAELRRRFDSMGFPANPATATVQDPAAARGEAYAIADRVLGNTYVHEIPPISATQPPTYEQGSRRWFGAEDLVELLTYRAANDPKVTSALEATLGGRADRPAATQPGAAPTNFSPLRDNRSEKIELVSRRDPAAAGMPVDRYVLAQQIDVRQHLTTLSNARDIRSGLTGSPDVLTQADLRVDAPSLLRQTLETSKTRAASPARQNRFNNAPGSNSTAFSTIAINRLFTGYADALLPFSSESGVWAPPANALAQQTKTLFYGHNGPELALHTAAHMALNLVNMYNSHTDDARPAHATLLVDDDFVSYLNTTDGGLPTDQQQYSFWHAGGDLDLNWDAIKDRYHTALPTDPDLANRSRLALVGAGDDVQSKAVNAYGITPEPFLTGMVVITAYTDADPAAGGDTEPNDQESTIKGDVQATGPNDNADFLFRLVAFQLTNPFGQEIKLSKDTVGNVASVGASGQSAVRQYNQQLSVRDMGDPQYPPLDRLEDYHYITFGKRIFPLVEMREESTGGDYQPLGSQGDIDCTEHTITIPAGKTIVCYALSQLPREALQRIKNVDAVMTPQEAQRPGTIATLIKRHLVARDAATGDLIDGIYHIPEIGKASGRVGKAQGPVTAGGNPTFTPYATNGHNLFGQLMSKQATGSLQEEDQTAELWRSVRTGTPARFDTQTGLLIAGTGTGEYTPEPVTIPAVTWNGGAIANGTGNVRLCKRNELNNDLMVDRLRAPQNVNLDVRLRDGQNRIVGTRADTNDKYTFSVWQSVRRRADPNGNATGGTIPRGAIPGYCLERKDRGSGNAAWNQTARSNADWTRQPDQDDFNGSDGVGHSPSDWRQNLRNNQDGIVRALAKAPKYWAPSNNSPGVPASPRTGTPGDTQRPPVAYDKLYPEITISDRYFSAKNTPSASASPDDPSNLRLIDLLLPLGIGPFQDPAVATLPLPSDWSLQGLKVADVEWTTLSEMLAYGLGYETLQKSADTSYKCAYNLFLSASSNPPATTPESTAPRPFDRGNLVLDDYAPFEDRDGNGVWNPPSSPNGSPADDVRRGLGAPMALNILDVFTVHPPNLERGRRGLLNINTVSAPVARAIPGLSPLSDAQDTTIPAYPAPRDQSEWWWPRSINPSVYDARVNRNSDIAATLIGFRDGLESTFRPGTVLRRGEPAVGSIDFGPRNASNTLIEPWRADNQARAVVSRVPAVREDNGFRGPGELLLLRARSGATVTDARASCNIDFLGYATDGDNSSTSTTPTSSSYTGVSAASYPIPNAPNTFGPNTIPNDYAEKLAIAGMAAGSTTTRSDTFAVWFVLNGYKESDVNGLKPSDPMTPSIARRFLMIVDRSNVTQKGQKPRIVAFKELPR